MSGHILGTLFKKRSVYSVLALSYLSILLLTLSSNIIFYSWMNHQITAKTEQTKIMLLTQLREDFEESTRPIENMANSLASDGKVAQYAKGIPNYSVYDAMQQLANYGTIENKLLIDTFLYIRSTDEVLTPTMRMDAEKYFKIMYEYKEREYSSIKKDLLETSHFQTYLPISEVRQYSSNSVNVLTYVQSFPISVNSLPLGQVICLINADRLAEIVEQVHTTTDSDVYILDAQNHIIVQNSGSPTADEEMLSSLQNDSKTPDSIFTKQVSDVNGLRNWKFVLSTPNSLYMAENRSFLFWMLCVSFIYLLVGLLIVRYFVERNYRPIREIGSLIKNHLENQKFSENEFQAIKDTLLLQFEDRATLNEQLGNLNPMVRKEQIDRLLKGMVHNYDEYVLKLEKSGIHFSGNSFVVVEIEIDEASNFFNKGSMEQSIILARLVVQNVGCELLSVHFICEFVEMDRTNCVFLVNIHEDDTNETEILQTVTCEVDRIISISEINGLILYAGISNLHKTLRSVPLCYDESQKALEYSKLWSANKIVTFSSLGNLDYDYYFPSEIEYQIVNRLRAGEYERAQELIDEIFRTNAKEKNINISAARNLLMDLGATLQKVLNNVLIFYGEEPQQKLDIYNYLQNPSLDKAQLDFRNIISSIMLQQEKNHKSKSEKMIEDVSRYLQEHVEDLGLDLNCLSQEFHMTPQYISSLFKRYTDKTVKEYISRLRLEKAKELLGSTNLPIKEIALKCGYANEIGIIRLFKKYESMPPGEYRSHHQ